LAVVVPASAFYFSSKQAKLYTASSEVLVSSQGLPSSLVGPTNAGPQDPTRTLDTLARVAEVPTVASETLAAVGDDGMTPSELLAETTVSADPNSDVLTFSVTDPDPGLAERLVNEYTRQFMAYRTKIQTAVIDNALTPLRRRIDSLQTSLQGAKPSNQDSTAHQQLGVLLSKQQDLENLKALQGNNLVVVKRATSAPQTQPKTARNVGLGVLIGLILGVGLAFLASSLDTRVRSAEEISATLGMPLLARVPAPPRRLAKEHLLAMMSDQPGKHGEAYRKLRTNFDFANLAPGARMVVVSSAVEREGKSTTVSNLAVALARSGRRVVLVDLDLRRPFVDQFFDLSGRAGVTDTVLGRSTLSDSLVAIPVTRGSLVSESGQPEGSLDVLPAGSIPPDPAEFVGSRGLSDLLLRLRDSADIVLIDSPPILPVSDALTLSAVSDGVLLVAKSGAVRRNMLVEVNRLLGSVPTVKLGFVLTNAQADGSYGYGGYYGGYTSKAPEGVSVAQRLT